MLKQLGFRRPFQDTLLFNASKIKTLDLGRLYDNARCGAKVDEDRGENYLACEAVRGVRHEDFTPEISIREKVAGGRRIAHTRICDGLDGVDADWLEYEMLKVMQHMSKFGGGITGIE